MSALLGYSVAWPIVLGGGDGGTLAGRYVTCNYFDVLRQPPSLGRDLSAGDCESGVEPVVVLSHGAWTRSFAADPSIVGSTLIMNGRPVTVAGVAAEDAFQPDLEKLDFFAPISIQPYLRPDRDWLASESFGWLALIGRQSDGIAIDQVRAELDLIAAQIDEEQPGRSTTMNVDRELPTNRPVYGVGIGPTVVAGLVPFALVLLVACANVANLFLARASARSPEIALRRSLGASRARVVQQLLAESVLVSLAGGVLGSMLAFWAFEGLAALLLSSLPVVLPELSPDPRVMAFALTLSFGAGVMAGLGPALRASGAELNTTMRRDAVSRQSSGFRLQDVLIGIQVAVCMVLLIGAGLLLRGLYSANAIDPGFPYRAVAVVSGDLRDLGYTGEALATFKRRLADEMRALPGVAAAGYSASPPWDDRALTQLLRVPDQDGAVVRVERDHVTPEYFDAIGIPIVRGRAFEAGASAETSSAVIVTESTAERLWPGRNAIGRTLVIDANERTLQVVGVAKDAQVGHVGEVDTSYVYLPPQRDFRHMLSLVVRIRGGDFAPLAPQIRAVLERLDVAMTVAPLETNLAVSRELSALLSGLAVVLGAVALALASVGIFGVVAYVVG